MWVFLALISAFLWGWVNIGDKYLVSKKFTNPLVYLAITFFLGIFTLFFVFFGKLEILTFWQFILLIIASLGYFLATVFYIIAIQIEEVSRINVWWNIIPIFNLLGAWFFIGEKLTATQLLALGFLILGAFLASFHAKATKVYFSKALILMILACLSYAVYDVIVRHLSFDLSYTSIYFYTVLFLAFYGLGFFCFKKFRYDFSVQFKEISWRLIGLVFFILVLSRVALMFNMKAVSLGPVALVASMEGFQLLFVFAIAVMMSIFVPNIISEEIDKKNLLLKFFALVLMLLGIVVLNI